VITGSNAVDPLVRRRDNLLGALAAARRRLKNGARSFRSISAVCRALSSKPADSGLMEQTDGRTDDGRTDACSAGGVNN